MANMSKRTVVRPVRLPVDLDGKLSAVLEAALARHAAAAGRRRAAGRLDSDDDAAPTRNDWMVAAVREKLAHQLRGQRASERRRATPRP